jgi:hypothetical protein
VGNPPVPIFSIVSGVAQGIPQLVDGPVEANHLRFARVTLGKSIQRVVYQVRP